MKALDYWQKIDEAWWNGNVEPMNTFINNSDIFFGRDGGDLYEAIHNQIYFNLKQIYSDKELANMLCLEIPSELILDENNNLIYDDKGSYSSLYWEYVDATLNDKLCDIQIAYDIGGKSALKEYKNKYPKIDNKIFSFFAKQNKKGYMEDILYGGTKMNDLTKLINKLDITTSIEDKPYVFWINDMMYVNDMSEHQFVFPTDLYHAWKFAHIFDLSLDYNASDDEVLELGKLIIEEYNDCDNFYLIDIDEYFNDIKKDFDEILNLKWTNENWQKVKRDIICNMGNNIDKIGTGGSATFIAKWLYDTINDRIVFNKYEYPHENKSLLLDLRCAYLSTDNYDVKAFAKALHNLKKEKYIPIDDNGGYLWINNCKYENVVHIVVDREEVHIYDEHNYIGGILRENINTFLVGYYYDYGNDIDINGLLDFDIKKVGDL